MPKLEGKWVVLDLIKSSLAELFRAIIFYMYMD